MVLKVRAIEKHAFRSVRPPSLSLLHSPFSSLSTLFLSTPVDNQPDSILCFLEKKIYIYFLFPFSSYVKNSIVIFFLNFIYLLGPAGSWLQHVGSSNFIVCGIQFPDQGSNPGPLCWELGVLATGHQGSPQSSIKP